MASPMDVVKEREIVLKTISRINSTIGRKFHITFDVSCWERDVIPSQGIDAQDVVNQQIPLDYDIFLCFFKNRIGTPTNRSISGTVEEYERALIYRSTKPTVKIMGYFISSSDFCSPDITKIKQKMTEDGILFSEIKDIEQFENEIFKHFSSIMLNQVKQANDKKYFLNQKKSIKSVSVALIDTLDRILLVQRSLQSKIGAGLWQIPGGKIEQDELPMEAALREIKEELSISLQSEKLQLLHVFHTIDARDRTSPVDMYLYIYHLNEFAVNQLNPNFEINGYEWVHLSPYQFKQKKYLGINRDMLLAVWREICFTEDLGKIVQYCQDVNNYDLPNSIGDLPANKLNIIYSILSLLGLVTMDDNSLTTSEDGLKIMSALIDLSRSNVSVFVNSSEDASAAHYKLKSKDYALLKQHRERSMYSFKSLLATLSCKAEIRHSVRDVCDVLLFGLHNGKPYILLRWDFYSNKFQVPGSGIDKTILTTFKSEANFVISKRLDKLACKYFDYLDVGYFTTYHFSSGSVNNDPILRHYNIDVIAAFVRKNVIDDFFHILSIMNRTTQLSIEYSWRVSDELKKKLNYFVWCNLSELLQNPINYQGHAVQGVEELITNIGQTFLIKLTQNAVPLTNEMVDDDYEKYLTKCNRYN